MKPEAYAVVAVVAGLVTLAILRDGGVAIQVALVVPMLHGLVRLAFGLPVLTDI